MWSACGWGHAPCHASLLKPSGPGTEAIAVRWPSCEGVGLSRTQTFSPSPKPRGGTRLYHGQLLAHPQGSGHIRSVAGGTTLGFAGSHYAGGWSLERVSGRGVRVKRSRPLLPFLVQTPHRGSWSLLPTPRLRCALKLWQRNRAGQRPFPLPPPLHLQRRSSSLPGFLSPQPRAATLRRDLRKRGRVSLSRAGPDAHHSTHWRAPTSAAPRQSEETGREWLRSPGGAAGREEQRASRAEPKAQPQD